METRNKTVSNADSREFNTTPTIMSNLRKLVKDTAYKERKPGQSRQTETTDNEDRCLSITAKRVVTGLQQFLSSLVSFMGPQDAGFKEFLFAEGYMREDSFQ